MLLWPEINTRTKAIIPEKEAAQYIDDVIKNGCIITSMKMVIEKREQPAMSMYVLGRNSKG
jgi:hypothetical protein